MISMKSAHIVLCIHVMLLSYYCILFYISLIDLTGHQKVGNYICLIRCPLSLYYYSEVSQYKPICRHIVSPGSGTTCPNYA